MNLDVVTGPEDESAFFEEPEAFFAEHAKVGVHNGETFGQAGRNFIRLNFACPRSVLRGALDRMAAALEKV